MLQGMKHRAARNKSDAVGWWVSTWGRKTRDIALEDVAEEPFESQGSSSSVAISALVAVSVLQQG